MCQLTALVVMQAAIIHFIYLVLTSIMSVLSQCYMMLQ
jgi:hypothetical protein